ncbi:MAG: hypothetical protein A2W85_10085 [Bacteroidetes bacterium GWF2_41_31]|nr:MAG: hypothetical protein A2W85_10085 [Bacteroidetes bacterium GWF2_41_31]OFZ09624.1 MAG: hypothetical protein A2338_07810 [Bacteroidetes bacterium RIFOXYB12_FULL_41_6]
MRHFSHWFLLLCILIFINNTQAQSRVGRYDWLLPDYVKLQYAGGIGFLSAGVGYTFVHQRIDATFFYGYVPNGIAIDDLSSLSLQFTAKLIRIRLSENYQLLPLNFGWFIHHTFGSDYWIKLPSHYPPEYYWWSPGRNAGIFIGGELKTKWLARKTPASGIAIYARIGTRGLYLASKVGNSSIPITDIIELGFGIALYR